MSQDRVVVFRTKNGQFAWRKVAGNNKITATSGESFVNRSYAIAAASKEGNVEDEEGNPIWSDVETPPDDAEKYPLDDEA